MVVQQDMVDAVLTQHTVDQHVNVVESWLPGVESRVLKFAPVSANYVVLEGQAHQIDVSSLVLLVVVLEKRKENFELKFSGYLGHLENLVRQL